jgi:hypothetical protein
MIKLRLRNSLGMLALLLPVFAFGQDLVIPPATSATDFLNDRITADITPTPNPNRVYVLQRNGVYFVNTTIRNTNWTFRMRAQDGTGRKPIIYLVRNTTTNTVPQFLDVRGNVWLKDLFIVGFLEPAGAVADIPAGLLQTGAAGFDIVVDGCLLTQSRGNHIRTDQAARVIKVANSTFTNMGDLGTSNFGAGKAVDIRGGSCDTLLMVNNTFVNFLDRIVRHRTSTAPLNHFIFDHNTVVNGTSYHGTLALGVVGAEAVITNNLFFDTFALGNDSDAVRQTEFDESGEKDQYGKGRMTWVISVPNNTTKWTVKGNYYTVSPVGQSFFDKYKAAGVTGEVSPLTYHINGKLGADSTRAFIKESLTLGKIPKLMVNVMDWYRSPTGGKKSKNTPCACWSRTTDDYDRRGWQFFADTLDCKYPTTTNAYTGAIKGYPAGDLNWYPALKAKWQQGLDLTGVKSNSMVTVTDYQLDQNYPNPFNPSTNITFALPKTAKVSLFIYNTFGQQVAKLLDNQQQPAGKHTVTWNGADPAGKALPSGMYFYRLQASEGIVLTRKMLLVK